MINFLWGLIIFFGISAFIFLFIYKLYDKNFCKYLALFCSVIAFISVAFKFTIELFPGLLYKEKKFKHFEDAYLEMSGKYTARYISSKMREKNNKSVIIIDYPDYFATSQYTKYIINGLKKGFSENNESFQIKAVEKATPKDNSIFWFTAEEFDRIVMKNKDSAIFISLVGLPGDLHNIKCQDQLDALPSFIFFGGNLEYLKKAIEYDLVSAAIIRTPGSTLASSRPPTPGKEESEFFEKFIIIDSNNIRLAEYVFPVLFK